METITSRRRALSEELRRISVVAVVGALVVSAALGLWAPRPSLVGLAGLLLGIAVLVWMRFYRAVDGLEQSEQGLRSAAVEAESHYVDVLLRIVHFSEQRCRWSRDHSNRVGALCEKVALQLGLSEDAAAELHLAGRLHDIGLLAIPEGLLAERGRLATETYRSVQRHPEVAGEILEPLESLRSVLPAITAHHERVNGTGYPGGLRGREIPIGARILAVADAYDAMTHDRPHRPAMTPVAAMQELRRCTPAGYEPLCVNALGEILHLPALESHAAVHSPGAGVSGEAS